jgi:cell division protein FtsW
MSYKPSSDKTLFFTAGLLTIFGLVMVYSASSVIASSEHGTSSYFFLRQLAHACLGLILLLALVNIKYQFWQKSNILIGLIFVSVAMLVYVFTQPKINGAHRWVQFLGITTFQPSEIVKLIAIMFTAWFLQKYEHEINHPKRLLGIGAVIGLLAWLIYKEPDLGQALTLCMIIAVMLIVAGLQWRYIAGAGIAAIPVLIYLIQHDAYRMGKIKAFLNPFADPLSTGWQITQSLIAVGSGGLYGLGPGASKQKLFFLPEASSDFIFAIIGEELGLIGTSLIVFAFLVYFFRGMRVVLRSQDRFGFYLSLGITIMVALQGFINISMVLAMMPTKGIALPFMSQGGSSLLLNLAATGILLNVSYQNKLAEVSG